MSWVRAPSATPSKQRKPRYQFGSGVFSFPSDVRADVRRFRQSHPVPAVGGHLSWSGSGGPAHQFWCGRDRRPHLCGGLLALLLRSATSPANTGLRSSGRNGFNRQRCRLMARPVPSPFLGVQAAARACRPLAGGVVLLRPFTSASRHQGTCPK